MDRITIHYTGKQVSEIRAKGSAMLREGKTVREVMEALQVCEHTVRSWASRQGIPLRKPQATRKPRNITPPPYIRGYVWGAGY